MQKEIEMEAPRAIDKYLGAVHCSRIEGSVTHIGWDMSNYLTSACVAFEKETDRKLKPATTPYVSDLPKAALDKNLATQSEFANISGSMLMKMLYPGRMAVRSVVLAMSAREEGAQWQRAVSLPNYLSKSRISPKCSVYLMPSHVERCAISAVVPILNDLSKSYMAQNAIFSNMSMSAREEGTQWQRAFVIAQLSVQVIYVGNAISLNKASRSAKRVRSGSVLFQCSTTKTLIKAPHGL